MNRLRLVTRAMCITALIAGHALLYFVRWLGMVLTRAAREERQAVLGRVTVQLCRTLGATFIKIGQFLSTRGDLIPAPVLRALTELQDRVGPFPYSQVRACLEAELGDPPESLFVELDPYPVASASVSQVHRGTLADGRTVAVKVLRPNIEATVRFDLQVMRIWARFLALLPGIRHFQPVAVIEEFASAVWQQLDLRTEAANSRRFAANFSADPAIAVPKLVDHLCTGRVLCMEFVSGVKILGPSWDPRRSEELARVGVRMLLQMVFVDGFVHADLHPGNLIVAGDRVYLVDLGMVAHLAPEQRGHLASLFGAWATQDPEQVAAVMASLVGGDGGPRSTEAFRRGVAELVDRYRSVPLAEVQLGPVFLQLARLLRRQGGRLHPSFTMVLVAIAVVEGVGRALAPHLDLVQEARRFFGGAPRPEAADRADPN